MLIFNLRIFLKFHALTTLNHLAAIYAYVYIRTHAHRLHLGTRTYLLMDTHRSFLMYTGEINKRFSRVSCLVSILFFLERKFLSSRDGIRWLLAIDKLWEKREMMYRRLYAPNTICAEKYIFQQSYSSNVNANINAIEVAGAVNWYILLWNW